MIFEKVEEISAPIYEENSLATIIKFLVAKGLLNKKASCIKCNVDMVLTKRTGIDGYAWRCPNLRCRTFKTIRYGSFFETNRIALDKMMKLLHHFSIDMQVHQSEKLLKLARSTIVSFNQRLRYICSRFLRQKVILLGGDGKIVEIDESMFSKIKHFRGKQMGKMGKEQLWVFGLKERESGKVIHYYVIFISIRFLIRLYILIHHNITDSIRYTWKWLNVEMHALFFA